MKKLLVALILFPLIISCSTLILIDRKEWRYAYDLYRDVCTDTVTADGKTSLIDMLLLDDNFGNCVIQKVSANDKVLQVHCCYHCTYFHSDTCECAYVEHFTKTKADCYKYLRALILNPNRKSD